MTLGAVTVAVALAATAAAGLRWLRVGQREHYLPGSATRFARRWWSLGPNRVLLLAWALGVLLALTDRPLPALFGAVAAAVGPFGLSLRGRTSPLAWTRRLRTLAAIWAALQLLVLALGVLLDATAAAAAAGVGLVPVLVDAAMALAEPVERRLAEPWVDKAKARLAQVAPTVVAITGSYGKTSTKGYVATLLSDVKETVPTPRSFNNRAGLARAVNEHLAPGTEVFVAEMGTYGPGEIAEMCSWCRPDVGVITAIGPVHLERMGSEETITEAKAEILEKARVAVLNVDNPHLRNLADRMSSRMRVVRCSGADRGADVAVVAGEVLVQGHPVGTVDPSLPATNVACAVAAAIEAGVPTEHLASRLGALQPADHRLTVSAGAGGFTIVDDTYNANPAGARVALEALARHATDGGKRVVVTPGMVELGPRQYEENRKFAHEAAAVATHLVVVGYTNRAALLDGAKGGAADVVAVEHREEAVAWVREHLRPGDAVLYENDLPDHFP